ncbi:dihydrofolate reductase [Pendulispora brunnea]|uniref:Dihydrofolate reductase n=1 Tax=Pendulispora brunnea TaxID=2905690 RepID=A0ABZ2KMU5_9BACT
MEALALIAAVARGGVIGIQDGGLPWRIPEDMRHFKRTTLGHAVIVGRKTYESFGKPLVDRRNIVVTRQRDLVISGCEVVGSLEDAVALARTTDPEPMVIGGGEIYRQALPRITRMYLTYIDRDAEGDVRFPDYDANDFRELERRVGETPDITFVTLERIPR